MKSGKILLSGLLILTAVFVYSQQSVDVSGLFDGKKEIIIQFDNPGRESLGELSRIVSIDRVDEQSVVAWVNKKELIDFLKLDIPFTVQEPVRLPEPVEMWEGGPVDQITDWDFYPTYEGYVDMMQQFANDYPDLVEVFSIGQTVEGRELLVAHLGDNLGVDEGEPQFFYTSTMHGDETTGYVLLLRLIDYLLTNYGSDPQVDNLMNNLDIWINPNGNPDGTYAGGNQTVNGATRYNANGIDLNRNFPDPEEGPHPDGNAWQPETIAMMAFAEDHHFVMSANYHGGAEVMNYPWDTWPNLHADDLWWQFVCHEYADTAQANSPSGYMSGFNDGITNGYAWYTISGGRQDYMNYFHQCREVTIEVSDTKTVPPSQLPSFWNYNYQSMLHYMEEALYGFQGTVTDAQTGLPIEGAEVFIENHDIDSSWVYTGATGKYYRPILEGSYTITISAPGYYPQTFQNISVQNHQVTVVDAALEPGSLIAGFYASQTVISAGAEIDFFDQTFGNPVSWQWTFEGALPATSTEQNPQGILYPETGTYDVTLTVSDGTETVTITKEDYIHVSLIYLMQNSTLTTCEGLFYDSGGAGSNYGDNENYTLTLLPATPGGKIQVNFLSFNVEYQSNCNYDWLKIYDGTGTSSGLIGTFCGTNSPGTVTATNEEGALTFQFYSDQSVTESGWEAEISCDLPLLPPVADFTADTTVVVAGGQVAFTDLSLNQPDSWEWVFEGGTPGTSSEQNPVVVYNTPGVYGVMLTVTNTAGTNTMIKNDYITVEINTAVDSKDVIDFKIYPNPASNRLTVGTPLEGTLSITDLSGRVVYSTFINAGQIRVLDISQLPKGVALVRFVSGEFTWVRKLTILK
ncbi:MAG: hypothetical protein Kow00127_13230 [Bacteroidales bacterium]